MIKWCQNRDNKAWEFIATGIPTWFTENGQNSLTASAAKLLEASPEPSSVLKIFSDRVLHFSGWGSRLDIIKPRAEVIKSLTEHTNKTIAQAAKIVYAELIEKVEQIERNEKRESQIEQRFE